MFGTTGIDSIAAAAPAAHSGFTRRADIEQRNGLPTRRCYRADGHENYHDGQRAL